MSLRTVAILALGYLWLKRPPAPQGRPTSFVDYAGAVRLMTPVRTLRVWGPR